VPRELFFAKGAELLLSRSYGPGRYDPSYEEHGHDYPVGFVRWTEKRNMEAFLDLLACRAVDLAPILSERFPVDRARKPMPGSPAAAAAWAWCWSTPAPRPILPHPPGRRKRRAPRRSRELRGPAARARFERRARPWGSA